MHKSLTIDNGRVVFSYISDFDWFHRTSQVQISLKQVEPEEGVTVVFHVLLVSSFKMDEEGLHIRACGEDLGNFKINFVDLGLMG